jgi:FKBP-type peptidyl-prolyl cis-trans isomerase SlyD
MKIADKTVVSFHYTLRDSTGEQLETSRDGHPTSYLHGASNIIRGLEAAMDGREAGDSFTADIGANQAYGPRREGLEQRVPIKHLVFRGRLKPGMVVQLNTSEGPRSVTVVKAGRHSADVDANHPLAGKDLSFEIKVTEVRAATAEELAHGHAHGVGGHQH